MPLPAAVRELAAARRVRLAWENEDALTFEVDDGPDRCFVKVEWIDVGLGFPQPAARACRRAGR